ncbi:MAG: reactive intermediate/imine deaminase [Spirochaetae bacterium HGW-Spirochaetae-8]|nr:MAG: reactive intermediate/imine deaminase [Spirochaetae bacterium HGW-Spirochaetae-8]
MKEIIYTESAPAAVGPYSQATANETLLFVSGQLPIDPATGAFAADDVAGQTRQCLENLSAILEAGGSSLQSVMKTTVYLKDISHFSMMNEVYASFFKENPPARAAFEVANLPKGALVEIEAIAGRV